MRVGQGKAAAQWGQSGPKDDFVSSSTHNHIQSGQFRSTKFTESRGMNQNTSLLIHKGKYSNGFKYMCWLVSNPL